MKKIDIWDLLWKPRLVFTYLFARIRGIGKPKDEKRRYLPMEVMEEDQGYPRPQFVRDSFLSLDGKWELSYSEDENNPGVFEDEIKVPFPPQAFRSGVRKAVGDSFWYKKEFSLPEGFVKDRVVLHIGAADQIATVYVNGKRVGTHEGGYLPFEFDITGYLKEGTNQLMVYIRDELDPRYPYGKQSRTPGEMWYSQISGIWRSVWLESTPKKYVESVKCVYKEKKGGVSVYVKGLGGDYPITVYSPVMGDKESGLVPILTMHLKDGKNFIPINYIKLWTPDTPWLYYFDICSGEDKVRSYFALRTVSIEEFSGRKRICLNHRPFFFHAVLDQGYYSDGFLTPPNYRYFESDIRRMKELGFNTLRKHIKVESARFYYDCDRIGMAVMQDMVNNGSYDYLRDTLMPTVFPFNLGHYKKDKGFKVEKSAARFFLSHSKQTQRYLMNFPCILYYTIFNEGWGQFNSDRVLEILRKVDPTRIYDSTSGWYKQKGSDVESIHCYFHRIPISNWKKPAVISEMGGFSCLVKDHSCFVHRGFGYGGSKDMKSLSDRIIRMYEEDIIPHVPAGICGSVYTQLSDVEEEINGLYTYDRAVCKVDKVRLKEMSQRLMEEAKKL